MWVPFPHTQTHTHIHTQKGNQHSIRKSISAIFHVPHTLTPASDYILWPHHGFTECVYMCVVYYTRIHVHTIRIQHKYIHNICIYLSERQCVYTLYHLLMLLGKIRDFTIRTTTYSIPHTFNNMFSFLLYLFFSAMSVCCFVSYTYFTECCKLWARLAREQERWKARKETLQNKHIVFARVCMCIRMAIVCLLYMYWNIILLNGLGFSESNTKFVWYFECDTNTYTHTYTLCSYTQCV